MSPSDSETNTENASDIANGVNDARAEIMSGEPRYFFQLRGSWGELFERLLLERFGVNVVDISCFVTASDDAYRKGYNDTVKAHLDATFGDGAFDRTWREVQQYREDSYARWRAAQEGKQ